MRGQGRVFQRRNSGFWWIAYFHRGKEFRESSHSENKKDAEKLLLLRLKQVGADSLGLQAFIGPAQDRVVVGELLDALKADVELREVRSLPQILAHLKPIRDAFGDWRARDVTSEAVDRYIQERLTTGEKAPATVNRETQLLSQAFRLAVDRNRLGAVPKIRKLSEKGNARQGFFEHADFEAVVGNLPAYLKDFARFGYHSAWRKGEIQSLLWTDVERERHAIRLRPEASKNGEGRVLVLEGVLWEIIERRWKAREYQRPDRTVALALHVFHRDGEPVGDFRKAWASACERAGVPGRLFHDLRRTAVRNMVRAGVQERVAMENSGHKTRAIFDRYNIVSEVDLREAQRKTQAYLRRAGKAQAAIPFKKAAQR